MFYLNIRGFYIKAKFHTYQNKMDCLVALALYFLHGNIRMELNITEPLDRALKFSLISTLRVGLIYSFRLPFWPCKRFEVGGAISGESIHIAVSVNDTPGAVPCGDPLTNKYLQFLFWCPYWIIQLKSNPDRLVLILNSISICYAIFLFLKKSSAMLFSFSECNKLNCILPKGMCVQVLIFSICECVSFGNRILEEKKVRKTGSD